MTKKRKKFTQKFNDSAVKLITEQGYKNAEVTRNLGINPTVLDCWKREIEGGGVGNSDSVNAKDIQAEVDSPQERKSPPENGE